MSKILRLVVLFSGNGSNLEAVAKALNGGEFECDCERFSSNNIESGGAKLESVGDSKDSKADSHAYSPTARLEIIRAFTNNPSAYGITRCKNLKIPCEIIDHKSFESRAEFDAVLLKKVEATRPDLVIMAGFMRIVSEQFAKAFRCVNIHPSFLPSHKGAHAIADAYAAKKGGGVSVHFVTKELDSGEIIEQVACDALLGESLESYEARIHKIEHKLYPRAILKALNLKLPAALESALESKTQNPVALESATKSTNALESATKSAMESKLESAQNPTKIPT